MKRISNQTLPLELSFDFENEEGPSSPKMMKLDDVFFSPITESTGIIFDGIDVPLDETSCLNGDFCFSSLNPNPFSVQDAAKALLKPEKPLTLREARRRFEGKTNPLTNKIYTDTEIGAMAGKIRQSVSAQRRADAAKATTEKLA